MWQYGQKNLTAETLRAQRKQCWLLRVFRCVLCASAVSPLLAQDDPELLRRRTAGDHRQIERYCRERLKDPQLPADARAALVAELAGSLAQQASAAGEPAEADRLWGEADRVLADFLKDHPAHPRGLLLRRQRLIYAYTRGETTRQQAEVLADDARLARARAQLERAETLALELDKAVRRQLDAYTAKQSAVPFEQLVALSNDTPLRLAQVRLSLALTHPLRSDERARLLAAAEEGFAFYTRAGYSEDEVVVRGYLGLAEARRLRGEYAAALQALTPVEESPRTPARFKDEAVALRMNVLLDQGQPQAARRLVQGRLKLSPEMALALVHALLLEARQAAARGDRPAAARLQAAALERIDLGEREYAGGWGLRAGVLLGRHGDPELLGDDLPAAVRLAESLSRASKPTESARAFAAAAALARQAKDPVRAFELDLRSGMALAQGGRNAEAAETFLRLAADAPEPAQSARARLLAAHALRRAWEQDRSPDTLRRLKQLLADHVQRHPAGPTAAEAHFLLGYVASAEGQWRAAIAHYAKVPAGHRLFALAVQETVRAYEALRLAAEGAEADRLTAEAIAYLARREKELPQEAPEATAVRLELRLSRGRMLARPAAEPAELDQARADLEAVARHAEATAAQRHAAQQALVPVLAALGKPAEAERYLATETAPARLRAAHDRLACWVEQAPEDRRAALAAVELAAIRRLVELDPKLTPEERQCWRRAEAWALARAGRHAEARRLFTELRSESPRDGVLLEEHARALMHMGSAEDVAEAVGLWQTIAAGRTEGTAGWFEAKYQLAVALARLGQKDRALKVLRVTYALWLNDPPDRLDAVRQTYQRQFKELEARLDR
jgi:TolA-binding protein